MKLLAFMAILGVAVFYGMGKLNKVASDAGQERKKELAGVLNPVKPEAKVERQVEIKVVPTSKTTEKEVLQKASLHTVKTPKVTIRRPSFYIKHRGIKSQDCNLAYQEAGETIVPTEMQIHDYFKWGDSKYYFAVSTDNQKFLLKATDIIKEKCAEEDLKLAFKFAKYCRAKDQPKPQVTTKPTVSETKDEWSLTSEEEAHIKSSIKTLSLKADHFRQSGNVLKIYEDYNRDRRKETFEKVTGTYYLLEGNIPETYYYNGLKSVIYHSVGLVLLAHIPR